VLHHTGGRFESDLATLTKKGTGVSANDFIDKQGRIFELCQLPKRAWRAGEASLHGITDWNAQEVRRRVFAATDPTGGPRIGAMAIHNKPNVATAANAAEGAPFRRGPRLMAIGAAATKAVSGAGQKRGSEEKRDLCAKTLPEAVNLVAHNCAVETRNAHGNGFEEALGALAPSLEAKL
jgi:hypothetical protein